VAKRSPILGYNHNVRHRGLLFHVQTEDSGVDNPHIFTHLFHGGVIISSRKLQYDRESAEEVVKSLMQAQHKASLRELKAGTFDEKISSYLRDHPDLQPAAPRGRGAAEPAQGVVASGPAASGPAPPLPPPLIPVGSSTDPGYAMEPSRTSRSDDVSAAFQAIKREPTDPATRTTGPVGKRRGGQTGYAHHRTGQLEVIPDTHDALLARGKGRAPAVVSPVPPRPPVGAVRPAGKPHAPAALPARSGAPQQPMAATATPVPIGPAPRAGVVVSRPAVIVHGAPRVVSPRDPSTAPLVPRTIRRAREPSRPGLFGKDLISERSLDEVILAYLSEDPPEK
jgi:hypothetical protein